MRKRYKEKHDLILNELRSFEKAFHISASNAGLHVVLTDKMGRREDELAQAARWEDVKVYQMRDFRMSRDIGESETTDDNEQAALILGYGALEQDEMKEGLARLRKAWELK